MRKLMASLLALVGVGTATAEPAAQMMDPNQLLFSIPTLSDDLAQLEPVVGQPAQGTLTFNEDDWSQVEFFPETSLPEIKRMLTALKSFEAANRAGVGWRNVFVRKVARKPVVTAPDSLRHLETILGVKAGPAPIVTSAGAISGRVKGGFSFDLGGNVELYGYITPAGLPVLGASLGPDADNANLTSAFSKLNRSDGLVLVDWRSQMLLLSVDPSGKIDVWRP